MVKVPIAIHSILTLAPEHQSNYILWRLAVVLGYVNDGDGTVTVDVDYILSQAEDVIRHYREIEGT